MTGHTKFQARKSDIVLGAKVERGQADLPHVPGKSFTTPGNLFGAANTLFGHQFLSTITAVHLEGCTLTCCEK